MDYKDYYKILGIDKRASEREIKKAYRKLARQYHPDVNPGDTQTEEKFKSINEAYEVLSDPEKRDKYDQLGTNYFRWQQQGGNVNDFDWNQWVSRQQGGSRVEYGSAEDIFGAGGFSDFFQSIFGGGMGGQRRPRQRVNRKGQDYEHPIEITLEEAANGTQRLLKSDGESITVKIPPGVKTGSKVRISGKGGLGADGGAPGDLYLRITVSQHPVFERKGNNLYCQVPLDLYTAVLGGSIEVPTIDGQVRLKIPAGTQGGKSFRLKGKGMPLLHQREKRGDLYIKTRITVPTKISQKERALFKELANLKKKE